MLALYVGPHVDDLTHLLLDTSKKNKVVLSPIITPSISNTFVFIPNIIKFLGPKFLLMFFGMAVVKAFIGHEFLPEEAELYLGIFKTTMS